MGLAMTVLDAPQPGASHPLMQLRATLTQREAAHLTLLETVQQLFVEHSPASSGGGTSPAKATGGQHRRSLVGRQQPGQPAGGQGALWGRPHHALLPQHAQHAANVTPLPCL